MAVDRSVLGRVVGRRVVVVERGPVSVFARAVKDRSPIYQDRRAAVEAGFADVPVPPTFPFAMSFWGAFEELQEGLDPVGPNPLWEVMGKLGPGLVLHAEQELVYHRPLVVGDVLYGEDVLSDLYEKETDTHLMTFLVTTTDWSDRDSAEAVVTGRFNLVHRIRRP